MPRTRRPITAAIRRWIHSAQAWKSPSEGTTWPWQKGQSGQPMPLSVARTTTPTMTSPSVAARVRPTSFWYRVTEPPPGLRLPISGREQARPDAGGL